MYSLLVILARHPYDVGGGEGGSELSLLYFHTLLLL